MLELVMYTKSECLLCDRLEDIIYRLINKSDCLKINHVDIKNDPELWQFYRYRIPVLLFENKVILEGKPDEGEILDALRKLDEDIV